MTNMTGSNLSICSHPGKITGYWITTRSFPFVVPCCDVFVKTMSCSFLLNIPVEGFMIYYNLYVLKYKF